MALTEQERNEYKQKIANIANSFQSKKVNEGLRNKTEQIEGRLAFWEERASNLSWFEKWDNILEWENPDAKWFVNGKLNASYNCLDRHLDSWKKNKMALIFEGEKGDQKKYTYKELHAEVCKFANVLKSRGVHKGDIITIYMPMIPETIIAMLACARLGAPHNVVFGGFSPEALRERINDTESRFLVTCDGAYRRGNLLRVKENVCAALKETDSVEKVFIVKRANIDIEIINGRDIWYHEAMAEVNEDCPPEVMDSEDMLFVLYTSGSTGKPKGIVHTTGGYLTGVSTTLEYVFNMKHDDVYWCTADVGWITGHSYLVYGPLVNGATVVMYEGAPDYPSKDRYWEIIQKHGVTIFYTAPTAIRTFMKWGVSHPEKWDLSSLRILGTVGEPINPEAWNWFNENIGGSRCPIMDTWWQTETGMIMISPLPGTNLKPGSCVAPFPGIKAEIVDKSGQKVEPGEKGFVVITEPWPSMIRTIYNDHERYKQAYWNTIPGVYYAGDGARYDKDGYFWILGRVDDVINVSGHRIGTAEVENVLIEHPAVAESACIGKSHEIKGQAIVAFVTIKEGACSNEGLAELAEELKKHVVLRIGAIARPEDIYLTRELPKTRSGKIIRRILRDIAEGRAVGDTTTLDDGFNMEEVMKNILVSSKN